MHNPEELSPNEEVIMLRSDLEEIFMAHADKTVVQQSDDWEQPAEVLLSGSCVLQQAESANRLDVHIRQRVDSYGVNYLIIFGPPGDYYWGQVTSKGSWTVVNAKPLSQEDAMVIRRIISKERTTYSAVDNQKWLAEQEPFEAAERFRLWASDGQE